MQRLGDPDGVVAHVGRFVRREVEQHVEELKLEARPLHDQLLERRHPQIDPRLQRGTFL